MPVRRLQPVEPTGTQGEEGFSHEIGIPSVDCTGASGELEAQQPFCDSHSTTVVRVSGSSGDSRYHGESLTEDDVIKVEAELEASAEEGSLLKHIKKGSLDHQ